MTKEALPSLKNLPMGGQMALGALAGGTLGGASSALRQKSDIYAGEGQQERINPYRTLQSALVGAGLGAGAVPVARHAGDLSSAARETMDGVREGAQGFADEMKNVSDSIQQMGRTAEELEGVAQKARKNRGFGLFSKSASMPSAAERSRQRKETARRSQALRSLVGLSEKIAEEREKLGGFNPVEDIGAGIGIASTGATGGYLLGRAKGWANQKKQTEEHVRKNYVPDYRAVGTGPDGEKQYQKIWIRRPEAAESKTAASRESLVRGGALLGVGGLAGAIGYNAGKGTGKENYRDRMKRRYVRGNAKMIDSAGNEQGTRRVLMRRPEGLTSKDAPRRVTSQGAASRRTTSRKTASIGKTISEASESAGKTLQDFAGSAGDAAASTQEAVSQNPKAVALGLMGAGAATTAGRKIFVDNVKDTVDGKPKKKAPYTMKRLLPGRSAGKIAEELRTIDMTENTSAKGRKLGFALNTTLSPNPQAMPGTPGTVSGGSKGQGGQPRLPSKNMRQDRQAKKPKAKKLSKSKVKDMT
jgi:hypothetical protein